MRLSVKVVDRLKKIFCRSVFLYRSISERSVVVKFWSRSQLKQFQSGSGVEKLATPQHSNSKTFQAKATLGL